MLKNKSKSPHKSEVFPCIIFFIQVLVAYFNNILENWVAGEFNPQFFLNPVWFEIEKWFCLNFIKMSATGCLQAVSSVS